MNMMALADRFNILDFAQVGRLTLDQWHLWLAYFKLTKDR